MLFQEVLYTTRYTIPYSRNCLLNMSEITGFGCKQGLACFKFGMEAGVIWKVKLSIALIAVSNARSLKRFGLDFASSSS